MARGLRARTARLAAGASVNAVFAAKAFHKLDAGGALAEIARVLRPPQ